jgi:F5/8 type C domain/Dolichyl-phosphate-mannose-protein mannosyltransferase
VILALSSLLGAVLTVAACYAAGAMLIDRLRISLLRFERLPLAFTLGAACLHLAVFAILALQIAYWPVFAALLVSLIGSAVATGSWRLQGEPGAPLGQNLKRICIVLFGLFTILYFFHAWAPEISPDGSGYHLGYVARYLRAHGFTRVTTDIFSTFSGGIEMLFVPAFAIGQHSAAALVHMAFTAALALAMLSYGRRIGKPWAGAAGAFLAYASPMVGIDGSSAYTDLGVAAVAFSTFYWLEIWDRTRERAVLIPIGMLAGYACATKYTAFVMVPFALGYVLWRARSLRPLIPVCLFSALMIAPWMLKNWIIVENPIAPFGNAIFRNPYFHPIYELELEDALQSYGVTDKRALPLEVTIRGQKTQGLLGVTFLLAPIALLALRFREGRRLLTAGLLLALPYYANIGTRFLIPPLPFISLAMAMALGSSPALLAGLMVVHAFFSWPSEIHRYGGRYAWKLDHILFAEALRLVPQEKYLREKSPDYGAARLVEATVPEGEWILGTKGLPTAYCNRDFLVSYQSALSQTLLDSIDIGAVPEYQPALVESLTFPEHSSRRFRVVQTGKPDGRETQWSVDEMRFYHQGSEIVRRAEWRLRAWPNPWEARLAFDNSLSTRWRTWETIQPGDYVDVDFGKDEAVDEIRIETSPDYFVRELQVEAMDSGGGWVALPKSMKTNAANLTHYSLRLAATYEMKARGIHYLLVGDDYPGASDIEDDPEAWGLTLAASGYGIRLYRVTQ